MPRTAPDDTGTVSVSWRGWRLGGSVVAALALGAGGAHVMQAQGIERLTGEAQSIAGMAADDAAAIATELAKDLDRVQETQHAQGQQLDRIQESMEQLQRSVGRLEGALGR